MAEFDEKAATWDDDLARVQRADVIADILAERINLSKVTQAMEYGSGTGLLSFALKDRLKRITLMDESESMTEMAKMKCSSLGITNLEPIQYNLMEQPMLNTKYDLIYILLTLHHIKDTATILDKFRQSLRTNGHLIIIDLESEDGSFHEGDFHGHQGFDRQELEEMLSTKGFMPVSYEVCYELENENDGDIKKYPLFMLIAKAV